MAFKRFVIDGFGQLELNQVAFPRDGMFQLKTECFLPLIESIELLSSLQAQ